VKYLYGDASESPLEFNYINFLSDVLDFSVSLLEADDEANEQEKQAKKREKYAATELEQLRMVGHRLGRALDDCGGLEGGPVVETCVAALREAVDSEIGHNESAVHSTLEAELSQLRATVTQGRAENLGRLEALLLRHDLPESTQIVNASLGKDGRYSAELVGSAAGTEVSWVMDLDIPGDHLFNEPVRIRELLPQLSITVPEEGGWVRKSVELRSHKLAKEYVVEVSHASGATTVRLRTSVQEQDTGYDFHYGEAGQPTSVVRVAKGVERESFAIQERDIAGLVSLRDKLTAAMSQLRQNQPRLRNALLDNTPIQEHAEPAELVKRLVAQIAPVVREIAKHSQSPAELVVKRVLADHRREETFASKLELLQKLDPLSAGARALFDPLGLGGAAADKAKRRDESPAIARETPGRPTEVSPTKPATDEPAKRRIAPKPPQDLSPDPKAKTALPPAPRAD